MLTPFNLPEIINELFSVSQLIPINQGTSGTSSTSGASGAGLFDLMTTTNEHFIVKVVSISDPLESLKADVALLKWLRGRVPVPRVVHFSTIEGHDGTFFEIVIMEKLEGKDLKNWRRELDYETITKNYALALKGLHCVDPSTCPVYVDLDQRIEDAQKRLLQGDVDCEDFEDAFRGFSGDALLEKLRATKPSQLDLVVAHGDYCLDNLLVKEASDPHNTIHLTGFIDLGRGGVQDRYQDLALAIRSVKKHLGPHLLPLFFEHYALVKLEDLDEEKVHFFILLDEFF